jgi:pantetheine-phosphate adenylyltransferase
MSRALYAGSFDPVTLGHVDVIRRGATLFEELVVAVGNNPKKHYLFDRNERLQLLADAVEDCANVRVVHFEGLLVHAAQREGASVLLRGLRAFGDFDLELRNGLANRDMAGIETVFMLADPQHIFVSSSLMKEIASNGGDISRYVPAAVAAAVEERLAR